MRTTHFETNLSYEEKDEIVSDKQTEKDVSIDIETVLKNLDPQDADLLSLVYYDGMRISQIAKMQGVPKTTVYSRFNKAKKNLKAQLKVYGIDKAIYSGNFVAMITTAIRNIIGTALLSFAIAQQILNSIIGKKSKKELAVAKIIKAHQKKLALKIASCIVAIAIFTSCFTVLALTDWGRAFTRNVKDTIKETVETITEYHYYTDSSSDANDTESEDGGGFWQNLFGGSKDDSGDTSSTSSESKGFWETLFGSKDDDSSDISSNSSDSDLTTSENTPSSDNTTSENQTTSDDQTSDDGPQSGVGDSSIPESSTPTTSVPSYTPPASTPSGTTSSTPTIPTVPDGFVADCDVSEYNVLGNEFSNYNVAMQGDWIYYCSATNASQEGGLYKIKKDGSQKQLVTKTLSALNYNYINVVGPWIYYISGGTVARMLTDGTGYKSLGGSNVTKLQVYDGYAYFEQSQYMSSDGGFKKMNLNTLEISDCNKVYFTDKYRICVEYDTSGDDNDRYALYDLKTGALAATISMSYGSISKCYNSALIIGKYVFDLTNLSAEPVNFHVNISDYKKATYFYSPYKGGCVGGWYGETMDGLYYDKFTGVIYMSDLSQLNWPFPWKCIDSVYGPLKTSRYAVFGDYVYYIDGATLHKILPDGAKHTVLG